ncbi:MAG: hypothetical protein GWO20_13675 [Candidatus Korarchaeota archaeon]|nr:hypothetical protein [Candidatus Korarchaeota archaeon]
MVSIIDLKTDIDKKGDTLFSLLLGILFQRHPKRGSKNYKEMYQTSR